MTTKEGKRGRHRGPRATPVGRRPVLASPSPDQDALGQAVPHAAWEGVSDARPGRRGHRPVLTFQSPSTVGLRWGHMDRTSRTSREGETRQGWWRVLPGPGCSASHPGSSGETGAVGEGRPRATESAQDMGWWTHSPPDTHTPAGARDLPWQRKRGHHPGLGPPLTQGTEGSLLAALLWARDSHRSCYSHRNPTKGCCGRPVLWAQRRAVICQGHTASAGVSLQGHVGLQGFKAPGSHQRALSFLKRQQSWHRKSAGRRLQWGGASPLLSQAPPPMLGSGPPPGLHTVGPHMCSRDLVSLPFFVEED